MIKYIVLLCLFPLMAFADEYTLPVIEAQNHPSYEKEDNKEICITTESVNIHYMPGILTTVYAGTILLLESCDIFTFTILLNGQTLPSTIYPELYEIFKEYIPVA